MSDNQAQDSTTPENTPILFSTLTNAIEQLTNERDELLTQLRNAEHQVMSDRDLAHYEARTALVTVLEQLIASDELTTELAHELFARFCVRLDKSWKNPFQTTWTVTVKHDYAVVMTVTGVEADDEATAIEDVRDNLTASDVAVRVSVSYEGQYECDDEPVIDHELNDYDLDDLDFDYEATQE